MLTVVRGDLGTGKTLLLSHFGDLENEVPVFTNYNLDVPNFKKKITPFEIENLYEGLVLLQGFYTWLDCRLSGSELNRYLSRDFVFNSRKRGLNVIVDFQIEDSIDKRFMKLNQIEIEANGLLEDFSGYSYLFKYKKKGIVYKRKERILDYQRALYLYDIYNTKEPEKTELPSLYEPNRLNAYVNTVIDILLKNYGKKKLTKMTKNMINDILLENGKSVPSMKLINLIYARIKRLKL